MINALWARVWPYIAAIGAAFAAVLAIWQSAKAVGRQQIQQEVNEAAAKGREKAREVEFETAGMADTDIDADLAKWVRNRQR
ncbi:MAG: hypothetical protein WBF88_12230 [Pusillimonas sp.]